MKTQALAGAAALVAVLASCAGPTEPQKQTPPGAAAFDGVGLGPGGYMAPAQGVGLGPGGATDSTGTVTTSTNGATDCTERGGVGLGPGGRSDECEGAVVNASGHTFGGGN